MRSFEPQCNGNNRILVALSFVDTLFFSGGRLEGSKRNLNFQGATWHHLKHLPSKDFFSKSIIICKLDRNRYHFIATAVAATEDLILGFRLSSCSGTEKII
jgi:hypothetical protein